LSAKRTVLIISIIEVIAIIVIIVSDILVGKKSFIDVFYHQIRNSIQGYTTRAPPLSRGGRARTGDQTIASPMP
jgi:hypothetical protein